MRNWSTVGAFAIAVLLGVVFLRGAAAEKAAFFDKQGTRRAALDVGVGGWPVFALADDRGDDRAVLQVAPDGTPVLVLFDKTGRVIWKTP